ncbi:MAG: hypothetical protein KF685_00615 [Acidobacteria bacterium]|nr:hypothetical protein [Acidobacteriota bacterium]
MSRSLEKEIFIPNNLLALSHFEISVDMIVIGMSSWEDVSKVVLFNFLKANVVFLETSFLDNDIEDEPDYLQLPWDTIGVESQEIGSNQWRFTFSTNVIEFIFESEWPEYDVS